MILVAHEKAKILFEPFLDRKALAGLDDAWGKYEKSRETYDQQVTSWSSNHDPEYKKDFSKYCLNHIDNLLSYAKPK
jgi:hypothetical protein